MSALDMVKEAQKQLRSTQINWQEDCLFECDDMLTGAIAEIAALVAERNALKAEASRKDAAIEAARLLLGRYGFVDVLNGSSGYHYLRCRDCNGHNENNTAHELNRLNITHQPGCKLAAALAPATHAPAAGAGEGGE